MFTFKRKSKGKKSPRSRLIARADELFSKLVRSRDGHCQWPGCSSTRIFAHHIFSRRYMQTRYDFENAVSLCFIHHATKAHGGDSEIFRDFVIHRIGEDNFVHMKARALGKATPVREADIRLILMGLKEAARGLG